MKKRGFTLIELLVAIAVIAILAAVIVPTVFRAMDRAGAASIANEAGSIKTAVMAYRADTGQWPNAGGNLLTTPGIANWDGPYLDRWTGFNAWRGTITLLNGATMDWNGVAGNDQAIHLEYRDVPLAVAQRLDLMVDGVAGNAVGNVRHTAAPANPVTVQILVTFN